MIDTKVLRRLAQAAMAAPDGLSVEWMDRLGQFQEAADASVVSELLDRLEAAESDAAHQKALADSALRVANGWERKCDALRAKVAEMEQQEPVGVLHVGSYYGEELQDWEFEANQCACDKLNEAYVRNPMSLPLYALPGAQNVPEKLCYDSRWEISIDYVDGWNAAVDMMRGKSPSWHCPDCCIAFPFGAPKSCPNDDARCNSLLAAAPESKI